MWLYDFYLNKRYRLYKKIVILDVEIYFYWKLKSTKVTAGKIRTGVRNNRISEDYLKQVLYKEIRKAIAFRIKKCNK